MSIAKLSLHGQHYFLRGLLGLPAPVLRRLAGPALVRRGQTLDVQVQLFLRIAERSGQIGELIEDIAVGRARYAAGDLITGGRPRADLVVTPSSVDGAAGPLPARIYRPRGPRGGPTLLYFHGGGYVFGGLDSHDSLCRLLCAGARCPVIAVDYRLAPEHPFPAAHDDACAAFADVVARADQLGVDPARIAVGGDSAGANLATHVAIDCARQGGPAPCFQLLFYPTTDQTREWPSYAEFASGLFLTRSQTRWFAKHYLQGDERDDPRASPYVAPDLSGLPPTWLATAGFDLLCDEGEAYAARLKEAGVQVTCRRFDSLVHGFAGMTGIIDAARAAVEEAAAALDAALVRPAPLAAAAASA